LLQKMDNEKAVRAALESALPSSEQLIDEDTSEYIASALSEDPFDDDTREAVRELILSATEDNEQLDGVALCQSLFELLDLGKRSGHDDDDAVAKNNLEPQNELRKLDEAVTMKTQDIQTFASGLRANTDDGIEIGESKIAAFYANMIDPHASEAAISERDRRKARQKEMRIKMEEEERQRAIEEAMDMLQENSTGNAEALLEKAQADNMQDVHLKDFDLPNLRGGGPNLLQNCNLTLSRGRRYGLMGRNGCGKTTFLTFLAKRKIPNAVPKNMNMLLVRQEIFGNEWTAVETVLKSDVKRESVRRYIEWIESELEKIDNPDKFEEGESEVGEKDNSKGNVKKDAKSRQRLRDRKKQNIQVKAKKAAASTSMVQESKEERRKFLNDKLVQAHTRMGEIEAEEGGDPEPRARKVLSGLGFSKEMQGKPTQELSGGWRMRVSLSCALFANPSLLLLDEPTNHLDLEAVLWLEKYLTKDFKGTLVVVSHDRHFLNEVVTDVVHFHKNTLTTYRGDISNFEAVVADNKLRQQRLREQQEAKRAHLQKFIDLHAQSGENGVKAARQRKSKMKKLDKLGVMAQDGKKYKASYDGDAEEVGRQGCCSVRDRPQYSQTPALLYFYITG
jgi:ATPase subunit of ABC transporter with duplicated ATPase domains